MKLQWNSKQIEKKFQRNPKGATTEFQWNSKENPKKFQIKPQRKRNWEIQPALHWRYLFSGFLKRNPCIAWNSKEIPTRREISFAKTFRIQKTFKKRRSAGLNISEEEGLKKGSDKRYDISAKSARIENVQKKQLNARCRKSGSTFSCCGQPDLKMILLFAD